MSNLTLEDIAEQARVSRSTVSRVVNNHPNVSEDVRKRVLGVIHNTGYHPHAAARALASQHSWNIGLILPHSVSFFFTDPYYPHLTKGMAQASGASSSHARFLHYFYILVFVWTPCNLCVWFDASCMPAGWVRVGG